MGVLACDRDCCSNIMCDHCVDHRWYVCRECMDEFKQYVSHKAFGEITQERLLELFEEFISTDKQMIDYSVESKIDDFFKQYYH